MLTRPSKVCSMEQKFVLAQAHNQYGGPTYKREHVPWCGGKLIIAGTGIAHRKYVI